MPKRSLMAFFRSIRRQRTTPSTARSGPFSTSAASCRNDVWHLDEVIIAIAGRKHLAWRAVDQDGYVLDEIAQNRRNTKAAKHLLTRLLKKEGVAPKRMITGKLRSYGAARRQVMPDVEHRSHKGLNNRAETAHAAAKTGVDDARLPIPRSTATLRFDRIGSEQFSSSRPAQNAPLSLHIFTACRP